VSATGPPGWTPPSPPEPPDGELPADFTTPEPGADVRPCYRHPDRETGVSCSNCGRPICYECMIPAPVGFRCPECVKASAGSGSRSKVITRSQTRSRWEAAGGAAASGATITKILIAVNVGMFLIEMVSGAVGLMGGGSTLTLVKLGALVPAYVGVYHEYWRLLSAMFLHGSLIHLAFNMYALYIGGSYLEMLAGKAKYLAIYLVAGVAGNVLVYLLSPPLTPTIGASTAIFGVFAALFVYSIHHRGSPVGRALQSMGVIILINLVITFIGPNISWQGHIGGLIGGVAASEALMLFGRRDLRAPFSARDAALVAGIVAVLVVLVVWRTATFPTIF
jgi:membrane associated rhomboid family serine protease